VAAGPKEVEPALPLPSYLRLKRAIDIIGSLALLVMLSPILMIASLLVLLDVGRPILFWQERLGWRGRPFLIYKFRTLRAPFESAASLTEKHRQPTFIGRLLRATRIDEIPQLLNVLMGDMSLIGPRPLLPEDQPANAAVRLLVRPGISGWAQVNGGKLVTKAEKEELDAWYIRHASLWEDLRIAAMTVKLLMTRGMASREASADAEQLKEKDVALERTIQAPSVVAFELPLPSSDAEKSRRKRHSSAS
jgi:lipopolysaccharide/colanic/teichoic acid biosynthesis glycosyltransferase